MMRYPRTRHTLSPSTRPVHHGRRTIVGRLAVLSVFMLLLGVTSTQAQRTGQDPRCANFSMQAKGLCTAAVENGCFEGVQSPSCDALTTNWNENCAGCDGPAPWACPCEGLSVGSVVWASSFATAGCIDTGSRLVIQQATPVAGSLVVQREGFQGMFCGVFNVSTGGRVTRVISVAEIQLCQQSIRDIAANDQVTCPQ